MIAHTIGWQFFSKVTKLVFMTSTVFTDDKIVGGIYEPNKGCTRQLLIQSELLVSYVYLKTATKKCVHQL